jgi:maltose O-acetyltransferase
MGYNIEEKVVIASSAKIMGKMTVDIGKYTFIGHKSIIIGGGDGCIRIGSFCDISSGVSIVSGTHLIDMHGVRSAGRSIGNKIVIEDGVWIGFGSIILPGVKIGYKSIVAAGSIVNKDVKPYSIVAGNPAKVVKTWDLEKKIWVIPYTEK